MPLIGRYRIGWTVEGGGPGVSTFHFGDGVDVSALDAQSAADNLAGFLAAFQTYLPDEVTIVPEPEVSVINDVDGELQAVVAVGTIPGQFEGSGTGEYAAGVGARAQWRTPAIRNGRRVYGTTFLAPLVASIFSPSGTLDGSFVTTVQTAGATLLAAMNTDGIPLRVWSRPTDSVGGISTEITQCVAPDRSAWLRSRKT